MYIIYNRKNLEREEESQESPIKDRLEKIEVRLSDIQNEITRLKGVMNPPHRPPKDLDLDYIIEQVKTGKSARRIAKMMRVRPKTITARLKKAGFTCIRRKWILPDKRPTNYENNTGKIRILRFSIANCSECIKQEKEFSKFKKRERFQDLYVMEKIDPYDHSDIAKTFALKILPTTITHNDFYQSKR